MQGFLRKSAPICGRRVFVIPLISRITAEKIYAGISA
jgi:hypothetical protein